jgi:transglutaminase-like putative cysteine protease
MPILSIRHVTTYHYHQPVAFGEHRMMLRPRDDDDQKVIESELEITPKPRHLTWTRDRFGNHVAIAHFADEAAELRFVSTFVSTTPRAAFTPADIEDFARAIRSPMPADDWPDLKRFIPPLSPHPELDRWSAQFFRNDGSADTHDLLVDMTRTIRRTFKHVSRHEKGIQDPVRTLESRQRQLPRPRGADDRGAALARDRRAIRIRLPAFARRTMTTTMSPAATPTPGSRSTFPVRAGSTSIRRAACRQSRIWFASRS